METHSSILAWKIPKTEEPEGLLWGLHGVAKGQTCLSIHTCNIFLTVIPLLKNIMIITVRE